ncbi:MAG: hypothetical protein A3K83_06345 [Omnitrophica WOR_2 bacterium RBG_13_44_8b]|nr:MAG: hypothetical protein A3K83_06345 [Omnitrophica WOR_2 bacterium RBG_13_44_8b]
MLRNSKKINIIVVLALLCSCALVPGGCAKREVKNLDSKGMNIVCFGDSITFGYGVMQGEDYPAVLSKMVPMPVINAGMDGDTSVEALRRIESDVLGKDPFLVIIEFAGNDFLEKIPLETTVSNIKQMVKLIQDRGALVAIVDISAGLFLRDYCLAFNKLAKEEGAIFVSSVLSGIITNPSMKSDFIHPNAKGYKIIAQRVHRTIMPCILKKTCTVVLGK